MFERLGSFVRSFLEPSPSRGSNRGSDRALKELMLRAMGDGEKVERLIVFEQKRAPGISRAEATRRANERWARDR